MSPCSAFCDRSHWAGLRLVLGVGLAASLPGFAYKLPFTTGQKYAAFDDAFVIDADRSENVEIVLGDAMVSPTPLFRADRGWEYKIENGYPSVVYDAEESPQFRLWYNAFISCHWRPLICSPDRDTTALLYAESHDGITWEKPVLNMVKLTEAHHLGGGYGGGNVLRLGGYGFGIFKDPQENDKSRLFKAFGMLKQPLFDDADQQLVYKNATGGTMVSANGLQWVDEMEAELDIRWDTHHSLFWYQALGRYAVITRGTSHGLRTLALTMSAPNAFSRFGPAKVDRSSGPAAARIDRIYLAVLTTYDHGCMHRLRVSDPSHLMDCQNHAKCELAWSTDLRSWKRLRPEQTVEAPSHYGKLPLAVQESYEIIPLMHGTYHANGCFAAKPVDVPGEGVRIYFMGLAAQRYRNRETAFSVARFRPDGLVGVRAQASLPGRLTTRPLTVSADTFLLTADLEKDGWIRVSMLDPQTFTLLEGMPRGTLSCARQTCQLTAKPILDARALDPWLGQQIRLGIELNKATLYTFAFEAQVVGGPTIRPPPGAIPALWRLVLTVATAASVVGFCLLTKWGRRCRQLYAVPMAEQEPPHDAIPIGKSVE